MVEIRLLYHSKTLSTCGKLPLRASSAHRGGFRIEFGGFRVEFKVVFCKDSGKDSNSLAENSSLPFLPRTVLSQSS